MVASVSQLQAARWPLLASLVVVLIVVRQFYASSSSGQPLEGPGGNLNGVAGGVSELVTKSPFVPNLPQWIETANNRTSLSYNPYPKYNSWQWKEKWRGTHRPCMGPRGKLVNNNPDDMIAAYSREKHAPAPIIGSYTETGLDTNVCFERTKRMLPYGFEDPEQRATPKKQNESEKVEEVDIWAHVRWGKLQQECIAWNKDRYEDVEITGERRFRWPKDEDFEEVDNILVRANHHPVNDVNEDGTKSRDSTSNTYRGWKDDQTPKRYRKKSAVVVRTYDGLKWTPAVQQHVRSYIMELSLHSGGEYEVIILSEVKDRSKKIFDYEEAYRNALIHAAPPEFRDITILFNVELIAAWFPLTHGGNDHTQTAHMHQPMQLLSLLRPDITHFWQTELDTRYTGHHYSLLESASAWSTAEPRRLLWERNARYYFPTIHGPWREYNDLVSNVTLHGGIWGPVKTRGTAPPIGPTPPFRKPELDKNYEWGVGEDADLIAMAPAFDVTDVDATKFMFRNHKFGYADGANTPAFAVATVPLMRFSKRLLRAMQHGQMTRGFNMMPEMFPESTALHHGLKLVTFPLPVYVDMAVSPRNLERAFSANEGATVLDSPYDKSFQEVWRRMTYWHSMDGEQMESGYARSLWDRWTGQEDRWEGEELERLCLPQMLLHPVKAV